MIKDRTPLKDLIKKFKKLSQEFFLKIRKKLRKNSQRIQKKIFFLKITKFFKNLLGSIRQCILVLQTPDSVHPLEMQQQILPLKILHTPPEFHFP